MVYLNHPKSTVRIVTYKDARGGKKLGKCENKEPLSAWNKFLKYRQ